VHLTGLTRPLPKGIYPTPVKALTRRIIKEVRRCFRAEVKMKKNMITDKQKQLIHIAKSQLRIDDELYRELLAQFKVKSSKELSYTQASKLIDQLKKKGFKLQRRNKPESKMATEWQLRLIAFLANQYGWRYKNGFELWLKKQYRKFEIGNSQELIASKEDAQWLIERLKQMTGISTEDIENGIEPFQEWLKENPDKTFKDWKASSKESVKDEQL
jgi:hypothetical protein